MTAKKNQKKNKPVLPRYSGKHSKDFWDSINSLPREDWIKMYSRGIKLQAFEQKVLNKLEKMIIKNKQPNA